MENFLVESNIYFEATAAVFGLVLCVFLFFDRDETRFEYRILTYACVLSAIIDVVTMIVTQGMAGHVPHFLIRFLNTVNYMSFGYIAYLLILYIFSYYQPTQAVHLLKKVFLVIIVLFTFPVILNLFFPLVVDYDEEHKVYVHGPLQLTIRYVIPLFIVTCAFISIIVHKKEFSRKQRAALYITYVLVLFSCALQAVYGARFPVAYCGAILGVYNLFFSIESPDYRRLSELILERQQAQAKTEEARTAKKEFFASMTHEIRTPMNAILGMNQIIQSSDQDPLILALTEKIDRDGNELLSFVNSVLDQAKKEQKSSPSASISSGKEQESKMEVKKLTYRNMSVLCVDDTPMNLRVLEGIMRGTGLEVVSVLSGEEAISKARMRDFDCIFLDHQMPQMDGIETFHALKPMIRSTPVIMMTGNSGVECMELYRAEGFSAYIEKPIRREKLFAVLSLVMEGGNAWSASTSI